MDLFGIPKRFVHDSEPCEIGIASRARGSLYPPLVGANGQAVRIFDERWCGSTLSAVALGW